MTTNTKNYPGRYFLTTITSFYLTSFIQPYTCSFSFFFSFMLYNVLIEIPYIHFIMKIFSTCMNVHIQEDCENSEILLFMLMPLTIFPPILVTHTTHCSPKLTYIHNHFISFSHLLFSRNLWSKVKLKIISKYFAMQQTFSQGKIVEMNIVCVVVTMYMMRDRIYR